jgi:hypothetical protein
MLRISTSYVYLIEIVLYKLFLNTQHPHYNIISLFLSSGLFGKDAYKHEHVVVLYVKALSPSCFYRILLLFKFCFSNFVSHSHIYQSHSIII